MSRVLKLILLIVSAASAQNAISSELAKATNTFSLDLFKQILSENKGNVVCSPPSLSTLLVMLQQAAQDKTLEELDSVLHADAAVTKKGYAQLIENFKKDKGNATLEFANAAFLNTTYKVKPEFKSLLQETFKSDIETVNFFKKEEAAARINSWVAKYTHNRIKELVKPEMFTDLTVFVLTNAIYFKHKWEIPFEKNNTEDKTFYLTASSTKKVPTMVLQTGFVTEHNDKLKFRWVDIPFQDDRFSMLIFLPDDKNGLDKLVKSISAQDLNKIIQEKPEFKENVILFLPKFKLQTTMERLAETLKKLGLKAIFTGKARLDGISEEPVLVSKVVQKAEMEVDEEGATASAATAIIGDIITTAIFVPPPPLLIEVDHPFLAFIVDNKNKVVLFASRVNDPTSS